MAKKTVKTRDNGLMVKVTVETEPAVIDYSDILAACSIEPDSDMGAPWKEMGGYKHRTYSPDTFDLAADTEEMRGYVSRSHREGGSFVVMVDDGDMKGWDMTLAYWRAKGCSRQVAAEMLQAERNRAIDQIADWYRNGYDWWMIQCDFKGEFDSLGGISGEDYARKESIHEVAGEVAAKLESQGYTVENQPAPIIQHSAAYHNVIHNREYRGLQPQRPHYYVQRHNRRRARKAQPVA